MNPYQLPPLGSQYQIVLGALGPPIQLTLLADGTLIYTNPACPPTSVAPFQLNAETDTVTMNYVLSDGVARSAVMTIAYAQGGQVGRTWVDGDLPVVGSVRLQVEVARSGDLSFPRIWPNADYVYFQVNPAIVPT